MLNDTVHTILKHIRQRWMFMLAFAATLALLIASYATGSVALAAAGVVIAFMAGQEYAGQHMCNECAGEMVVADPVLPDTYRVLDR